MQPNYDPKSGSVIGKYSMRTKVTDEEYLGFFEFKMPDEPGTYSVTFKGPKPKEDRTITFLVG